MKRVYVAVRLDEVPDVMLAWSERGPAEEYVAKVNGRVEEGCPRTLPVRLVEAALQERTK